MEQYQIHNNEQRICYLRYTQLVVSLISDVFLSYILIDKEKEEKHSKDATLPFLPFFFYILITFIFPIIDKIFSISINFFMINVI
jgi:hypothetical protein